MKTTNDIDSKIEKALQYPPDINFSDDFSDAIIRKIETTEARLFRSQWIVCGLLVASFSLASIIILVIFMENVHLTLLLKASSWVLMLVGLLIVFQIIENKYLKPKSAI